MPLPARVVAGLASLVVAAPGTGHGGHGACILVPSRGEGSWICFFACILIPRNKKIPWGI